VVTVEQAAIRHCEERDLDRFGVFGSKQHVEYCRKEFAQTERVTILVAIVHDVPAGKAHVHFDLDEAAMIEAVAVVPELQRRGIGTALIGSAEALAAEHGYDAVQLGVEDRNPDARRLYERLGYRSVARMDFQYEGAPSPNPGVMMRKALA
jgi:ribosomal protein S18 acetylase RimI-like enzyme